MAKIKSIFSKIYSLVVLALSRTLALMTDQQMSMRISWDSFVTGTDDKIELRVDRTIGAKFANVTSNSVSIFFFLTDFTKIC